MQQIFAVVPHKSDEWPVLHLGCQTFQLPPWAGRDIDLKLCHSTGFYACSL